MKISFAYATGSAVCMYHGNDATIEEAAELLHNENVIRLTVIKMTPKQYLKTQPALNVETASQQVFPVLNGEMIPPDSIET